MCLNPTLAMFVIVSYIVSICALVCCGLHRSVPINYILLTVFTVCVSFIVAISAARYDGQTVVEAACLTASVVIALTVYAWTTKTDFTLCGPIIFVFGFVFCVASLFSFMWGPTMNLIYACIGVILFSFYLIYDTQMSTSCVGHPLSFGYRR